MSKIQSYDKNSYPSITDAIYEIMDNYLLVAANNSIYDVKALNEVCFFLAANNIQHEYVIVPAPAGAECDEVISLVWMEPGAVGNEVWYSRGKVNKNTYHVNLTIRADSLDKVEDWVNTLALTCDDAEIDITDWSVEEI